MQAIPPASDLAPIGLSSWVLPEFWLFATVVAPSGAAAWLAWRRSRLTPTAVILASVTLAVELLVQIPFVGFNVLQVVVGGIAVLLARLAVRARRTGRRSGRAPQDSVES